MADAIDPKRFDGNVKYLTRHLLFDSLVIAITTIIIGLPAVNWIYTYLTYILRSFSIIKCFHPSNLSASTTAIEYFCLSYHSLYTSTFPVMVTFFGFLIAIMHYLWTNNNSGKFELFFSLVQQMKRETPDKNVIIIQKLREIFLVGNKIMNKVMYISYVVVKVLQAIVALVAFILTLLLLLVSPFNRNIFNITYDSTFYCQLDQFAILNSSILSSYEQVPCVAITSQTTLIILYIDLFLLFGVFTLSFLSIFPILCTKELKYSQAAKFSFRTGMSPHDYYQSKRFHPKQIGTDFDFLVVFLLRTDSGQADILLDTLIRDEIKLLTDDDHMRSDNDFKVDLVDPGVWGKAGLSEYPDDLQWTGLERARQSLKKDKHLETITKLEIPQSFRGALLGYSTLAAGQQSKAVYITFDSTSLGIPLALSFVFENVYVLSFDPFKKTDSDGSSPKIDTWSNIVRLIFPHDILSSGAKNWPKVTDGIERNGIKEIDFIVIGPVKDKALCKIKAMLILDVIESIQGCLLLVITPRKGYGITKFFQFSQLSNPPTKWTSCQVKVKQTSSTCSWPSQQKLVNPPKDNTFVDEFKTEDGSFTFDLYQYSGLKA